MACFPELASLPRLPRLLIAALAFLILGLINRSAAAQDAAFAFQVQAAKSDWSATSPPATGWTDVTLPDSWTSRWPGFDGVVWYRIEWTASATPAPSTDLSIEYMNMAGEVFLNGTALWRDEHLEEPLSRSWNAPRYLQLPASLLHAGANVVTVRVSGLSAYQPGLGPIVLGPRTIVQPAHDSAELLRKDLPIFSLAITATLGGFFLVIWCLRRAEAVYGWFALQSFAWLSYGYNLVASSPWPFSSTHTWEAVSSILFILYCSCFLVFLIRFSEKRLRRIEMTIWIVLAAQALAIFLTPTAAIATVRAIIALIPAIMFLIGCIAFIVFALRTRRAESLALSACLGLFVLAAIHDMLVFLGLLHSNFYYASLSSQMEMVAMAVVLAWRFVGNLKQIEGFNAALSEQIAAVTREIQGTLQRQHELELANATLDARLRLAHDLHDGLGGTLVSNILALEQAPKDSSSKQFLAVLRELRDDLRIIIDTASTHQSDTLSLLDLIAPLRHRLTQSFEAHGVQCTWHLTNVDTSSTGCIDILRIIQEGLTNVLKHSGANQVEVTVSNSGTHLQLVIVDNGCGFDTATLATSPGTGLRSLRARTRRLDGTLEIRSDARGTMLSIMFPSIT